jgi:hypothetical protein
MLSNKTTTCCHNNYTCCVLNISDESSRANQNTYFISNIFFYRKSCLLWNNVKNTVESGMSQMTVWHIHIACWITKARDRYSEYVKLIAYPLQQWLKERISALRYTYIVYLVSGEYSVITFTKLLCVRWIPVWWSSRYGLQLWREIYKFSRNPESPQNSSRQKGDTKQVLYRGPTQTGRHRTKFGHPEVCVNQTAYTLTF